MSTLFRSIVISIVLIGLWGAVVALGDLPKFILPAPWDVAGAFVRNGSLLLLHTRVTVTEIVLGLGLGVALGLLSATLMAYHRPARRWLLPVLVVSQALPVFAIAPLLVLWFGYGLASKIVMATLIIFFPVTASFLDGLRRTERGWLDLAQVMGGSRASVLFHLRIPAALPALASGLRVATAVAPIGAVVGEWVGSSAGLGYLMLHANAQLKTDLMFAALAILGACAVALYYLVDICMNRLVHWNPETDRIQEGD